MIQPFVNNPRIMVLSIAVLIVWGLAAFTSLPRSEDPTIIGRAGIIITPFPGASAERVEALVTEKLENRLRELPELNHIMSTSRTGLSFITLEVKESYSQEEVDLVWSKARDLMTEASQKFPPDAGKPTLDSNRNHAFTMLLVVETAKSDQTQIGIINRHAKELESQMRSVAGTDLVAIFGAPTEEVLVTADALLLANAGLVMNDLAKALQRADSKTSSGQLHNPYSRFAIELAGELDSIDRVRQIPVISDTHGNTVRIGDLTSVKRGEKTPIDHLAIINGKRAIVVGVRMVKGIRVDHWTSRVETRIEQFSQSLPKNVKVSVLFNQNSYTQNRLGSLLRNVIIGFALIMSILFVTLGWRAALIVALALPLTVLFTFGCMKLFSLPIHQMSITGLVVALGIMVDNAIVMVNTISREKRNTSSTIQAVTRAIRHLWLPLLGSTLTTILAFMPIALMPGGAGEFVGGIGLSVIFSLVGSYAISHTIIAGLAGRFVLREKEQGPWWNEGIHLPALANRFRNALNWAIHYPYRTIAMVMTVPLLGFISAGQLTEQFFPPADRDMFHIEVFMPESSSLAATQKTTERIETVIASHQGILQMHWFIGRSVPSFYYNLVQQRDGLPSYAQAIIKTENTDIANRLIPLLQQELDNHFPEAQILVRKLQQGPPFSAPLEYRIYGPNLARLKALGDDLRRIINETPGVIHSRASLGSAVPQIVLRASDDAVNRVGLSHLALSTQMRDAMDGIIGGSILEANEELFVRVRLDENQRKTPADLTSFNIVGNLGDDLSGLGGIPLFALGELEYIPRIASVSRRDGQRINIVEGYIKEGLLPATVAARAQEKIAQSTFTLPAGYVMEIGGEAEKRNDSMGDLTANLLLVVTLLVLVIVLSFNSFRMSFIIFTVAIQAAGLGILSIYLFGYPFGFMGILGLLGLIGLAINAAIVILAELKASPKAVEGDLNAIIYSVEGCSRHISSTTITTVGGFLPLIIASGNFWPPFAIAIAGGTVLTTLLSFFFVPALFYLLARKRPFDCSQIKT